MIGRRTVVGGIAGVSAAVLLGACAGGGTDAGTAAPLPEAAIPPGLRLPPETAPHERTFMAYPSSVEAWDDELPAVRRDIVAIARAIAEFEPVVVLARPEDAAEAGTALAGAAEVLPLPVQDLWIRDTGPVFVHGPDGQAGVDLNFNGWGDKQDHTDDGLVARRLLEHYGLPRVPAPLVGEGGSLELGDDGTLLTTESALVNDNRNPGRSRESIEQDLVRLFGPRRVVWLPGVRGLDITDGHVDGVARFTPAGAVLLDRPGAPAPQEIRPLRRARAILERTTDRTGRLAPVLDLAQPDPTVIPPDENEFLASYINFYLPNGGVVMPAFGDARADDAARALVAEQHPGRRVVQLRIDTLAGGGGGIHCATQQHPAQPPAPSAPPS